MKREFLLLAILSLITCRLFAQSDEDKIKPLTLAEFNAQTGNKNKTVLAYFHANWCMLCRNMRPIMQDLDSIYGSKLEILDIDTDRDKEVAEQFEIDALPIFMLYDKGQFRWIHAGIMSEQNLRNELDAYVLFPRQKPTR